MHPLLTPWVTDCQCCWLSFSWAHADRNRVCRPPQVQGRWGRWKTEPAHRRWPQTSTWSDRLHKAHTLSHSSQRLLGWSTKSHDRECVWENVCVHRTVSVCVPDATIGRSICGILQWFFPLSSVWKALYKCVCGRALSGGCLPCRYYSPTVIVTWIRVPNIAITRMVT